MADWTTDLYETAGGQRVVEEEIKALGREGVTQVIRAAERLRDFGWLLAEPHVKHVEGKLWELRPDRSASSISPRQAGGLSCFLPSSRRRPGRRGGSSTRRRRGLRIMKHDTGGNDMARHRGRTIEEFKADMMQDPEFRKEWEATAPRHDLAEALIRLRVAAGLTQEQLADRIGSKQAYVARIESRPANLTLKTLARIAAAVGADVALRFERGEASCIDVKIPAAAMLKNGTLERFE